MISRARASRTIDHRIRSGLSLPQFPIGTAIGVYALVILFNDESKRILTA